MTRLGSERLQAGVSDLIGDYVGFFDAVSSELHDAAIPLDSTEISHVGFKATTFDEYRELRDRLFEFTASYVEDAHNGRPIAKLILSTPLRLGDSAFVELIELMPPKTTPARRPGLEHVGFVLGDSFDRFVRDHEHKLTGRQDQGPYCQPAYITFGSGRRAKFYDRSLRRVLELEGHPFVPPPA